MRPGGARRGRSAETGRRRRRGSGRTRDGDRLRAARHPGRRARRRSTRCRSVRARSATRSARSRSSTGWAAGSLSSTRGSAGTSARCSFATNSSTASTCCRKPVIAARRSSTCSNTGSRSIWSSAHATSITVELRWENEVTGVSPRPDGVDVTVATPEGDYTLACDWLVVADGSRSPVRSMLGLEWQGQVFRDRFLIADIHMKTDFPTERWFWFDPPFHPNQSALLHRQADDVWRVDFQLGWDADPDAEKQPERIVPRLRADAGRRRGIRHRVGERLHVPMPADAALPARPRDLRRRRGTRRLAVRCARREQRHPGRGQPRLEARTRDEGTCTGHAARYRTTPSGPSRRTKTS